MSWKPRCALGLLATCLLTSAGCSSDPTPATSTGPSPGPTSAAATATTTQNNTPSPGATQSTPGPATTSQTQNPGQTTFPDGVPEPGPLEGGPATQCGQLPFDPAWFRARIARLSGAADAIVDGQPVRINERFTEESRRRARAWIKTQYEALGYQVQEDPYTEGVNLIISKPGINPSYYVISAHYDGVPNSPGADDDATGVVTGLAIAAALAPCTTDVGVRFLVLDQEERKMTGAFHYARTEANAHRADQILGAIQVEMTGWDADGDGAFNIINCDEPNNQALTDAVNAAVKAHNLPLFSVNGCTTRSDHQAFWSIERPAIAVSELFFAEVPDRTPCYHQTCDTYDKVNFNYMNELAKALTHTTFALSGAR